MSEFNTQNSEIAEDIKAPKNGEKLILHACCGPCSLEPYRILKNAGWDITIVYSNSNIYPESEFHKRFNELSKWAQDNKVTLIKDKYDAEEWSELISNFEEAEQNTPKRKRRCSACYKLRVEHAAKYAKSNNIKYISSTLAVSPYQYNDVLNDVLEDVSVKYDLTPVFMDFRPYYSNATKRSKEIGMYRQKYCGCEFSLRESKAQFIKNGNKKYLAELESIA